MEKVSIIIPCRNERAYLKNTIDRIFKTSFTHLAFEVLIIDGKSDDGTQNLIEELRILYPDIKVIINENQTTCHAFNIGIEQASGNYIVFVGARFIMCDLYLDTCVDVLKNKSNVGCVGGRIINFYNSEKAKSIGIAMNSTFGVGAGNWRALNTSQYVDTVSCAMYTKDILNLIGPFDENLVRNQDDDYNFRLLKAGFKVWLEVSISYLYIPRSNFKNLFSQYFQYGYWKVYVNKKHRALTTIRQIVPSGFVLFFGISILISFLNNNLYWLQLVNLFYLCILIFFGIIKGIQNSCNPLNICFAIGCLHFGYGLGYLKGIKDFFIFNRSISNKMKQLTR